ncbi:MAG: hypothetical protein H5U28_07450 [Burkholderiaceae bacterium]|nr:hypothetical protein [Burkholderiaceae bacterium]
MPGHSDIAQLRYGVSRLRNPLLAGHAFHILPYQGLGTGIPRVAQAWANIDLQDHPAVDQFKAVVHRPVLSQTHPKKAESQPESQPESALPLETRVLHMLGKAPMGKREISAALGQKEVSGQLNKVIRTLLVAGQIELTIPHKPNSRLQQYRLTQAGQQWLAATHRLSGNKT